MYLDIASPARTMKRCIFRSDRLALQGGEMPRKLVMVLLGVSLAAALIFTWFWLNAPPTGIEGKGGQDGSIAVQYISLATAVVSLLTAIVGLMRDSRKSNKGDI
jgi:polyferredoxin